MENLPPRGSGMHELPPHPQLERAVSNPIVRSIFSLFVAGCLAYISLQVAKIEELNDRVVELEKWRAVHDQVHRAAEQRRSDDRKKWEEAMQRSTQAIEDWMRAPDHRRDD